MGADAASVGAASCTTFSLPGSCSQQRAHLSRGQPLNVINATIVLRLQLLVSECLHIVNRFKRVRSSLRVDSAKEFL